MGMLQRDQKNLQFGMIQTQNSTTILFFKLYNTCVRGLGLKKFCIFEMEEEHKSMSLGHQTAGGHFGGGDTFLFYHYTAWLEN